MDKKALLVMNMQKDFLNDDGHLPVAREQVQLLLETANEVITRTNAAGIDVVYIGNEFDRKDWLANLFRKYAAIKGQPGTALDSRLQVVNNNYFDQTRPDAFSNPRLQQWLKQRGITHLIVVGVFAAWCVSSTALSAKNRGYQVTVLTDAVACSKDSSRGRALRRLHDSGIATILSGEFLNDLSR